MTKPTPTNTTAPNIFSNNISPSCLFKHQCINVYINVYYILQIAAQTTKYRMAILNFDKIDFLNFSELRYLAGVE